MAHCIALVLLLGAVPCRAATRAFLRLHASAEAAATCPLLDNAMALKARVDASLGYAPWTDTPAHADVALDVVITQDAAGLLAVLSQNATQESPDGLLGQRTLRHEANACASFIDAMVLALALAIDPMSVLGPAAKAPPPAPPAPPAPVPAKRAPVAPARAVSPTPSPVAATEAPVGVWLDVAGHLALGTAPNPAAGGELGAALTWRALAFELRGWLDAPSGMRAGLGSVSVWLAAAAAGACVRLADASGCAQVALGSTTGEGLGLNDARSGQAMFGAAGLRAGWAVTIVDGWTVEPRASVWFPWTRVRLTDSQSGEALWQMAPVAATFSLAVGARVR